MSLARKIVNRISEEEYLSGELISEIKHEYVDGEVFAMAGASKKHNLIALNIASELRNHLKNYKSSCSTYTSDMKARISQVSSSFFYPDVMVVCDKNDDDYYQSSPVIIVEVLSKSTSQYDKSNKRIAYFNIPSLKEYVLIEQDKGEVVVFERDKNWQASYYFLGQSITFESINVTLSVEDIYYQIESEEMEEYFKEKELDQELKEREEKL